MPASGFGVLTQYGKRFCVLMLKNTRKNGDTLSVAASVLASVLGSPHLLSPGVLGSRQLTVPLCR